MPELPEVMARKRILEAHGVGRPIRRIRVLDRRIVRGSPAALARRLKGATLVSTRRHGKYLFAAISGGGHLVFHFGMTGRLIPVADGADLPPHTKLALVFDGGAVALRCPRMFEWVRLIDDVDAFIAARQLGPDAMSADLTAERFAAILAARRGKLKATLLDQSVIAGLGNLWADETCFQARLHPGTAVNRLSESRRRELYRVMRRVLEKVIPIGGGEDGQKLPPGFLLPQRGPEGRCPACGRALTRGTYGARTTWFCPHCQKRR